MKIDLTKLKGEDLLHYFTTDHPDEEYRSVVGLLPYVVEFDKACKLLERSVREGKTFVAVYPGIEDVDTSGMEYIGEIIDGGLYLK